MGIPIGKPLVIPLAPNSRSGQPLVSSIQGYLYGKLSQISSSSRKYASILDRILKSGMTLEVYNADKSFATMITPIDKAVNSIGVFNPKDYVASDARIIACAKSKPCDVLLTGDHNSFLKIARKAGLPVTSCSKLPLDLYDEINFKEPLEI